MPSAADTTTDLATRTDDLMGRITALVARDGTDWDAPSPCAGWSAADVLDHLVETERGFLADRGVELSPLPDGDRAAQWREHAAQVVTVLADPAVVARGFEGYFGPTTIGEAWGSFYVFDLVVHRWDLARSLGGDAELAPSELELVEATVAGAGAALYTDGICADPVELPADATRQDRVLASTGRDPR